MILADSVDRIYEDALSIVQKEFEVESCAVYAVNDGMPEVVSQHGGPAEVTEEVLITKRSVYGEKEASVPVVVDGAVRGIISLRSRMHFPVMRGACWRQ